MVVPDSSACPGKVDAAALTLIELHVAAPLDGLLVCSVERKGPKSDFQTRDVAGPAS